jgi:phosphatidate phosphatase LPIN
MPPGPVIMSPDRAMRSGVRELIIKKPHIFKIGTLGYIRTLFPDGNVFFSGFGNRDTDAVSYLDVGIPLEKILIVNPAGQLHHYE